MKIRNKIFLNLFLVVFFCLATVSLVAYFNVRQTMTATISGYNYLLAQDAIDSIDRFIDRRLERWQSYVGSNPDLLDALNQSNNKFSGMENREEFIKTQDEFWAKAEPSEITPFMKGILENNISEELRAQVGFYEQQTGYKIFPEFFITNKYGVIVSSTNKTSDYLQSDEEWWQKAKDEGTWVSDIVLDQSSGVYSLGFCIRINDKKSNFIGAAKIIYDIKDVFKIIESTLKLSTAEADTTDLGFTRKTLKVNLLTNDGRSIYSNSDGFGNLRDVKELLDIKNRKHSIRIDEGVEELYSYGYSAGFGDFKGLGWILVVEKDTKEVLAPLNSLLHLLGVMAFIIFLVVSFIALFLSSSLVSPLKRLTKEVEKIEKGDLNTKINITGRDEISQLGSTFNKMASKLGDLYHNLEEKVRTRTDELTQKNKSLEETQKAMANLVENLNTEKNTLAKQKAKDEAILNSIGDGVFVLDCDKRIILFNPVAEKISGFTVKEAMGQEYSKVLKFVFEKDGTINNGFVDEAMSEGKITQMANHTLLTCKDGTSIPVADSAAPIKDTNGKIFGCVVVFRDVTKEREIDKMKTEFISVASHQLRTPLTGIKWFSELLLKNKLSAQAKDYIRQISISNERMVMLVDDLLNASRIEAGKNFDIVLENTDIVPVIKGVLKEQMPSAEKKQIALVCHKDAPKELTLTIDELKIRQVFQNLISNAIKYSKDKTEIIVGCEKDKDNVVFYVKDGGIGIPKHQQNQIFNKFFRAQNALTMQTDGTGLGLYIVKAIVEAHNGKVWFESTEGMGTTFYVSLPTKLTK